MTKSLIPMSQGDLYLLLPLAWQTYREQLPRFSAYKSGYTAALADAQAAALAAAQALPDDAARSGQAEAVRQRLLPQLTEYLAAWYQLDGYIEEAYPDAYAAMRDAAGHRDYDAAGHNDWARALALMAAAGAFVRAHEADLRTAGQMPGGFPATLAAEAADVAGLLGEYQALKGSAQQGTTAQQTANKALFDDYQKMNRDAQRIFRLQPDTARLFQTEYLLGLVRGPGQAGVRGTLTLPGGAPAPGVAVEITGPKTATTDAAGRRPLRPGRARRRLHPRLQWHRLRAAASAGARGTRREEADGRGDGAGVVN